MISTEAFLQPAGRARRGVSVVLAVQFLLPAAIALLGAAGGALGAPIESQDAVSEMVTARFVFNGTEGGTYLSTQAGPQGAELGNLARNITVGQGVWGDGAMLTGLRERYPGNLTLNASGAANEVFFNRVGFSGRDADASGNFVWNTGTTNSAIVGSFDQDGDGILDDVFLANSSNANRITTWNQAGTLIGTRRIGTILSLNDAIAVDANADGRLEQIAVAHEDGRVFLEPANLAADVWVYSLPGAGAFAARLLAVADLDSDSFIGNVIVASEDSGVYALSASGTQLWAYNTGGAVPVAIDGYWPTGSLAQNGVLVAAADAITALNWQGAPLWNYSTNATVRAMARADLDGDRLLDDVLYGDDAGGLTLLNETGAVVGYTAPFGSPVRSIARADLGSVGTRNEFVATNDSALVAFGAQLQSLWTFGPPATAAINEVIAADLDGEGFLGDSILGTATTVFAVNRTGAQRWNYSGPYNTTNLTFVENPGVAALGSYESPAFEASPVAAWGNVTTRYDISSPNETLNLSVRFGTGTPSNITWGGWSTPVLPDVLSLAGNWSRFLQVRYEFSSLDGVNSSNLSWFRVDFGTPALTGSVQLPPFSLLPPAQWVDLDAQFNLSGGAVRLLYSADGGASWSPFAVPSPVDGANTTAASLTFRVEMDVGAASPNVAWIEVRYRQPSLRPTIVTPLVSTLQTGNVNVSAVADASIGAVAFSSRNTTSNATSLIGPGTFDGTSSRWYVLWNTSGLLGGAFALSAVGTDPRGFTFVGGLSPVFIDNAPPNVSVTAPAQGAVISGAVPVSVLASLDVASVQVTFIGLNQTFPIGFANQTSPGVWAIDWDTIAAGVSEEVGLLSVTAVDRAGLSTLVEQRNLVVDNVDPWVRIDSPTDGTAVNGTVAVVLTAAPDVVSIDLFQNGNESSATRTGLNATESRWTASWNTFPEIVNPSATLLAWAVDRAGHSASASVVNLSIDNSAPSITLVSPVIPGAYTGVVHLAASAPGADLRLIFYYVIGLNRFEIANLSPSQKNATSGLWEFDWDTGAANLNFNGSILIEAYPTVGLVGSQPFGWIVVDNRVPFVTMTRPAFGTPRVDGNYAIEAVAESDVVSMTLSYINLQTGVEVPLGAMSRAPSGTYWQYTWAIGSLFIPYATLRVVAVDGVGLSNSDSVNGIIIGLNPDDEPPTLVRGPAAVILDEDFGSYEINITGLINDDDPANVTVFVDGINSSLVTLRNNGSRGADSRLWLVSVPDAHSLSGPTALNLRVVDTSGQVALGGEFTLYIQERNDPPSWLNPHDKIYVQAGVPYELDYSFYVHDVEFEKEGKPLFIATDDPTHISQNTSAAARLSLRFNYPADFPQGPHPIRLNLSDGDSNFVPPVFAAQVIVTNDAVPHLIQPLPPLELYEDTPKFNLLDLHDYFDDLDEEPLFYYNGTAPGFVLTLEAGVLSIEALPLNWNGKTAFFLGASDFIGAYSEARIELTVVPVNDVPQWDFSRGLEVTDFFVHYGVPFLFDLGPYLYDVDSNRAALIIQSSSRAQAHALRENGTEGTPGDGLMLVMNFDAGFDGQTVTLSLYATDGEGDSLPIAVRIHVSDNYPPEASQPLPVEIVLMEGELRYPALTLSDYFTDPDGVLFYFFGLLNVTVSIDADTKVTLEAKGEWSGTETLIIRAKDNRSAYKDSYILITVVAINDAPRILGIPDYRIEAGTFGTIFVTPYILDPDSPFSSLTYTVSTSYPGAFVRYENGNLTFVYPRSIDPTQALPAFDSIQFCVSDGGEKPGCRVIAVHIIQPAAASFNWLQFFIFVATAGVGSIVVARHFVEFKIKRAPTVEDIFLVYEDGILIKHISKNVRKYADEDVVTSMLSAIQSFAADSFEDKDHWELREVQFQGRKILIEKARKFQIILIFDGDATEDLKRAVRDVAAVIEEKYRKHLKDWDGDPSHFDGVDTIFRPVLALESAYIPGEVTADELVKAPLVPGEVYVSETANFAPLLKAYPKELDGLAVVRVRPDRDAGVSIAPLKPTEVLIVEVAPPQGDPEDDSSTKTGLDIALEALKEALNDSKVAVRGRAPVVMFEGFEWILDRYGFVFSKKFSDQLKKLAAAEGFYLFIAVDASMLSQQQLEGIERGAVVFRGA